MTLADFFFLLPKTFKSFVFQCYSMILWWPTWILLNKLGWKQHCFSGVGFAQSLVFSVVGWKQHCFSGVGFAQSLVFSVAFYRLLSVSFFLLVIVLSVLHQLTVSNYPFDIFKLIAHVLCLHDWLVKVHSFKSRIFFKIYLKMVCQGGRIFIMTPLWQRYYFFLYLFHFT